MRAEITEKTKLERSVLDEAAVGLLQMGDRIYGRLRTCPKISKCVEPNVPAKYYDISAINRFRDFVIFTADKMAEGGIHDHLGGGFARMPLIKMA